MISVANVSKSFGEVRALTDVSFTMAPGRMTGFVGGNGAGKTTTMRIILGVLEPDAGEVLVDDRPIGAGYRARIGYMPEERGLYPKMKVLDQLVFLSELHGIGWADAKRRALDLLDRLGLAERAGSPLEELSLGNQQRAQIAAALVHDPVALILDEPFSGLDPVAVDVTLDVVRDVAEAGVPVLFSSHQLDVVERLCDTLVIIAGGQVRAAGTRDELLATADPVWELDTDADTGWVRGAGVRVEEFDGGHVRFHTDDPHRAQAVLAEALRRGTVHRFGPVTHSLHDLFKETIA